MTIGHIMLDLQSFDLTQLEREVLRHPQVGGVILFTRNYESKRQLHQLTKTIRQCSPDCLIAVDQEGGRVQRFRHDFLPLPAFKKYGEMYQQDKEQAISFAEKIAYSMAKELLELSVDMSFTPVLDIDNGSSQIIGDRSFHHQSAIVVELGRAFIQGMHEAGMPATGKHFPGHGSVIADSHLTLPIDSRHFDTIFAHDMQPFLSLKDDLDGIMPAHILYENVDEHPTCFSSFWLQNILRDQINFQGVIFSDDLSMAGAEFFEDYRDRASQALSAGCDMVLICNHPEKAIQVLDDLERYSNPVSANRLCNFRKRQYA